MSGLRIATKDDDNAVFQLLTSPPLTGTLAISRSHKEHLVAWLLDLPNGLCFQKFEFLWRGETDGQWVTALVEACSDTLEHVDLCSQVTVRGKLHHPSASTIRLALDLNTRLNQKTHPPLRSTSPRR